MHMHMHIHTHRIYNLGIEMVNMFVYSLEHDCLKFGTCMFIVWNMYVYSLEHVCLEFRALL